MRRSGPEKHSREKVSRVLGSVLRPEHEHHMPLEVMMLASSSRSKRNLECGEALKRSGV